MRLAVKLAVLAAVLGGLFVGGALLVAGSGVIPIAASSGHWAVTEWFLHFSMKRSISTHSWGIEVPGDLDDGRRVLRGAGHYATGCFGCHGGPGARMPAVAAGMTPQPPYLPPRMDGWEDGELFTILKHGIKFAGMPAWPTQLRDEEVWDVVAFLRELPGMDREGYGELIGEAGDGERLGGGGMALAREGCFRCHGEDGMGRGGAWPVLAGQRTDYLEAQLRAYRDGGRPSGMMEPVAQGLSDEEIAELAAYFADLPGPVVDRAGDDDRIERGRVIAEAGIPGKKVASCLDCHGVGARDSYPRLAGQEAWYLIRQLELFAEGVRGGSEAAHLMEAVAPRLTDGERRDVAAYFASLGVDQGSASP